MSAPVPTDIEEMRRRPQLLKMRRLYAEFAVRAAEEQMSWHSQFKVLLAEEIALRPEPA